MSKLLSVAQLRVGDRFEFVAIGDKFAGSQAKDSEHMMIVANEPKVNRAANSCFFRYKAEADPIESRSWNGTAEIEVRVFTEHAPQAAAPPTPPARETAHSSNGHAPLAKVFAEPAPVVDAVADSEPEAAIDEDAAEVAEENSDENTDDEAAPAKPARKKAAAKTAVAKKSTKVATVKPAAVKAPAVKKKPAKAAAVKTTATKKTAKPAAKKKA